MNIIITGASRGIGRATAEIFAQKGNRILLCCYSKTYELSTVKDYVINKGADCRIFTGDISNYEICRDFFELAHDFLPSYDLLINNAGISITGLFQDMSYNDWKRITAVNTDSVFNCCHFCVPVMISQKSGKIINVSSVWGNVGASCEVAYSATKGAINSFTKALAKELAPSNIQVNAAAFGAIDTDMNSHLSISEKNELSDEIPAGRFGLTQEAANLIKQISESPEYLTGQIITMDGGWI